MVDPGYAALALSVVTIVLVWLVARREPGVPAHQHEHNHEHEHEDSPFLLRRLDFLGDQLDSQEKRFSEHDHPHEHEPVLVEHHHDLEHAHGKVAHQHDFLWSSAESKDGREYDIYRCLDCDDRVKFSRRV